MDLKEALFMKGGGGDSSYAQTSSYSVTQKLTFTTKPVLEKAVQSLFSKGFHLHRVLNVADLGCAAGPNTFSVISTVKVTVEKKCQELNCPMPELQFYLNDLPGNDFNSLFKGLSTLSDKIEGPLCFVMGAPGSFHGRLFPRKSLHLVHSSYSAHWLSQEPLGLTSKEGMPLNKGKLYISKTSPPVVREAYLAQFQRDFTLFLKSRSEEMVADGQVMLILHGRQSTDSWGKESSYTWELLAEAIAEMVSQGLVNEEKLDSYNVPYYTPSTEEVQDIVKREGSFKIDDIKTLALDIGDEQENDKWAKGKKVAKHIRSYTESVISYQFGEEILEKLYDKLTHIVVQDMAKESTKGTSIVVVLSRSMELA